MRLTRVMLVAALCAAAPARAEPGDKAGWTINTDPRGRAFLQWVAKADGPRTVMLGCLRDAETFTVMSEVVTPRTAEAPARLVLANGAARFEVTGEIARYARTERLNFIADIDVDAAQRRALAARLLPVLEGRGDIMLTVDPGLEVAVKLPIAGLAAVLGRFKTVCFR